MSANILFIIADDLNSWIGSLGRHPDVKTPNIDALAARGTLFTHAYCSAPYCNASRMGIFTGLLPTATGIYQNEALWDRPERPRTLIERLREGGYYTFGAGKVFHGVFDYATAGRANATHADWLEIENRPAIWDDFRSNDAEPLPDRRPLNRLFDFADFDAVPPMYHHFDWGPLPADRCDETPDAKVVQSVSDFLLQTPQEPFLCAAGLYKPHLPWHAPARFFELYDVDRIALPLVRDDDLDDVPPIGRDWASSPRDHDLVTGRGQWREAVRGYLAAISYCDHLVGEIVSALDRSGVADRTAIVFCGDNGFHLGEKLHWRKFALWEEATRVPLIIVSPGSAPGRRRRVHDPVSLIDLYPTLMELGDLPGPSCTDGISLAPWLGDAPPDARPPAVTTWGRGNHSIRTAEWRLIRYRDGTEELYDHRIDPHEWTNLATVPGFETILNQLRKFLPIDGDGLAGKVLPTRRRQARPDFLGIGAQKAGTTWLYQNLIRHPAIKFPGKKEIHFWDDHKARGTDWWLNLFGESEPGIRRGEITPAYAILMPDTIRQIADLLPDLRLIYSIRNPIARAWSSALMELDRAQMTIDQASDTWFIDHFCSAGSRLRGSYSYCLGNWAEAFPPEQIHLILFDDLVANPKNTLAGVARHLDIDPDFFLALPHDEISRPVHAGPGHPLPPGLLECLRVIYQPEIEALEQRLHRELGMWLEYSVEQR